MELQLNRIRFSGLSDSQLSVLIVFQCALLVLDNKLAAGNWIFALQLLIEVVFVVDIVMKARRHGWRYWRSPLNVFDALIVFTSIACHFFLPATTQSYSALRVIRLLRLFKIVKLIPNAEHIVSGVGRAVKASRGVFLMLVVLLVFFSMLGFILFGQVLPQYFGDPILASYTVFSLFTVEGWNEIPNAVTSYTIFFYLIRAYVIAVIIFGSFFALSLANAIFIDEMVMDNNEALEQRIDELTALVKQQNAAIEALTSAVERKSD
uniref:ion transporter n=1 Tax=Thaumasiovibrio occultus TaxID=1891184 RepID=UPI000B352244|nr:ion transporter [Thaumasiovibrio occultus]